ncbi:hypothetical protein [Actinomadura sp. DC4]|uniref:hypothetical protein n=1 Tax=Actinomadura sp. DC4 TaxID=3055069 RepID=UPI0025B1CE50|nr:hypothetical protein [Actinomadura sp. DC4]MDN3356030.1 hypothetical protein [Actinomadura sp. DC4]
MKSTTPESVTANVDQAVVVQLLAARWPVGTRVRHKHSLWTGVVAPGDPADCPGVYAGDAPAHAYLPAEQRDPGLVCVLWDHPNSQRDAAERRPHRGPWPHPEVGLAWMRPGVLRVAREREVRAA